MELAPDITQPVQKETSQQKPDAIKTTPSINEAIKADEEQPVAEMETASDVSQPVEGEVVQRETDSVERTLPIDKTVTTGEEQPLAEMETASDVSQPVKEEVSQQKPDTVKTVTAVIPAKNDHPFAVNVPPESAVNKEEEIAKKAEKADEIAVESPPFTEGIFPCNDCHSDMEPNPTRRELIDMHDDISANFDHDSENRWCLDCHDLNNRDSLKLASGKLLDFNESYKLCGQCHGDKLRDWKVGVHGKRTGNWNGENWG